MKKVVKGKLFFRANGGEPGRSNVFGKGGPTGGGQ
jgi:hypothetical protein